MKYYAYLKMCLRSFAAYKGDYALYMAINMVFFYISIALWYTVYRAGGIDQISDYTLANTITYMLLTTFIYRFELSNSLWMAEEIWNGYFTNDLIKPWDVIAINLIASVSDVFIGILSYIPFLIIMAITSFDYLSVPSAMNVLFFLITLILSFLMNFYFNLIFHSLAFKYGDRSTMITWINFVTAFMAGSVFPLTFIGGWAERIIMNLPFKYLFFTPIQIFLGKMDTFQIYQSWLYIVLWTILFYIIFKLVYNRGLKHYEAVGR